MNRFSCLPADDCNYESYGISVLSPESFVVWEQYLFSSDASEELKRTLAARDHTVVLIAETNLVDQVWGSERPSPPTSPLRLHDIKFAGVDTPTKIANLRKDLVTAGATAIILTMLDEVAWLLNLVILSHSL